MLGGLQGGRGARVEEDVALLERRCCGTGLEVMFERGATIDDGGAIVAAVVADVAGGWGGG